MVNKMKIYKTHLLTGKGQRRLENMEEKLTAKVARGGGGGQRVMDNYS